MSDSEDRPVTRKEFYQLGLSTFLFIWALVLALSVDTEWLIGVLGLLAAAVGAMYGWRLIKEQKRTA